jgi:hypothetical protein
MRINLFVDDDPVETEQNGTKTDSEQEKIEWGTEVGETEYWWIRITLFDDAT